MCAREVLGRTLSQACIAAHAAIDVLRDQKGNRSLALSLDNESSVRFQQRADERRQSQRFTEQQRDGARVIVPMQDWIERAFRHARDAATHGRVVEAEGRDDVVSGSHEAGDMGPVTRGGNRGAPAPSPAVLVGAWRRASTGSA